MVALVDIILPLLCTNIQQMRDYTCEGDELYEKSYMEDISRMRKSRMKVLADELEQETFKIATVDNMPLSGYTNTSTGLVGDGAAFDFFKIMQDKYKFKYTMVEVKDKTLDVEANSIMKMLGTTEIDIGVAFLPVMTTFKNTIDYSRALDEGEWVMLMRRPQESATGSGLFAPFTVDVWLLILLSLIVVGPVIYALILLEVKLRKDEEFPLYPLPACVWFVYGALLKQGSTLSPITDSSRMLFATWWIFITILTAFYTANLTAFLTLSKFTLPIGKAEDIGKKHYSWVAHVGTAVEQSMKIDNSTLRSVTQGAKYEIVDLSGADILREWVHKRNYMFLGEKPTVEYLMYDDYRAKSTEPEDKRCTFVITPFTVAAYSRAFGYRRGFKYYELFDEIIQHLFESGIVKFKLRKDLPNTEICPMNLGSKERQLRNSDLFMTYVLVGAGFGVAAVIFIVEQLLRYFGCKDQAQASNAPKLNNFFSEKSIMRSNKREGKFKFATFTDNNHVKGTLWHEMNSGSQAPPPPPYHALFQPPFPNSPNGAKKNINGRDYWVVKSVYGETKFIPVRTPSALLFQYNNN